MSLHTWPARVPASPAAAPLHAQLSLGQSCHRQEVLHLCTQGHFGCVRLCDPVDCGPPGFSVREGVLQARILERIGQYWLPYPSVQCFVAQACLTLCHPWTAALQAPLSMGFSRQEYWSGLPCPPPGDLPNLGIEPRSPALQADSLPSEPVGKPF